MTFWDRFVLWVYLGMRDTLPVGRDAAARIFNLAFERGRLVPNALNDLSLLLLLACCPANSPAWTAASQESAHRNFLALPPALWPPLLAINPPALTDLLEIGRPHQPLFRTLMFRALIDANAAEVTTNLAIFLGRLFLAEPISRRTQAVQFITQAVPRYYRLPLGTVDFPSRLYRHVLRSLALDSEALPSAFPAGPRPAWFTSLHPDEQEFMTHCLDWLSEGDLVLLYLQGHARLTVGQIASAWQGAGRTWTPDEVARELERCWGMVL